MSEDDLKALVRLDFYHRHNEAVAKHDLWVYLDTMAENSDVKLLTLISLAPVYVVFCIGNHAALKAAPGAYLRVPPNQRTYDY